MELVDADVPAAGAVVVGVVVEATFDAPGAGVWPSNGTLFNKLLFLVKLK